MYNMKFWGVTEYPYQKEAEVSEGEKQKEREEQREGNEVSLQKL